jgi:fibro-slime domain-containing protein
MFKQICLASTLVFCGANAAAATAQLTGTVRDFIKDGVNFENPSAVSAVRTGLVSATIAPGGVPSLTPLGETLIGNTGAGAFDNWYSRPTELMALSLTLDETFAGSGIYSYSSNAFYPIDGQLFSNEGDSHNYAFTYAIHARFAYVPGTGQTFAFTGDDDVWVYFDGQLGVDLGGTHSSSSASVNLDSLFGPTKPAGTYAFDFFFAERHTTESNLAIQTSLLLMPPVPEPASAALMVLGLAGAGVLLRRRCGAGTAQFTSFG